MSGKSDLDRFQDEVWGAFDQWGKALGFPVGGHQPEFYVCMDTAVGELVSARARIAEALTLIDKALGDTDPSDPEHPLLKACQALSR